MSLDKSTFDHLQISAGLASPYGATIHDGAVNFSIYVRRAAKVSLCLFCGEDLRDLIKEFELDPTLNKTGEVWHIRINGLPPFTPYAYRVTSQQCPQHSLLLLDPYAKSLTSHSSWGRIEKFLINP